MKFEPIFYFVGSAIWLWLESHRSSHVSFDAFACLRAQGFSIFRLFNCHDLMLLKKQAISFVWKGVLCEFNFLLRGLFCLLEDFFREANLPGKIYWFLR